MVRLKRSLTQRRNLRTDRLWLCQLSQAGRCLGMLRLVLTKRSIGISNAFFDSLVSRRWSRKRGFGRGSDVREWEFGIAGARCRAVRGHFAPILDSGPSASLRVRCRPVLSSWFRLRHRGRRGVTRLQRAVRAGRVGSALSEARRAFRSGRGWRGWRWVLRCWPRSVACRRSGCTCSRRC